MGWVFFAPTPTLPCTDILLLYNMPALDHVTLMYNSFNKEGGLQESNKLHTTSPKAGPKDRPSDNLYRDGILYSTGTGGNYRR